LSLRLVFLLSCGSDTRDLFAICYARRGGELTPPGMITIASVSILACLGAAVVFEPVERLTRWVGNLTASVLMGRSRSS